MTCRKRKFFFRIALYAAVCGFYTGCSHSSVPFTSIVESHVSLKSLSAQAKNGLLSGLKDEAWFSFAQKKLLLSKDEQPLALEVIFQNETVDPVGLTLAFITDDDFTVAGTIASKPKARPLSSVENALGITQIRMTIPMTEPNMRIRGFVASLSGTENSQVRILSVSIVEPETGWQRNDAFFWAGFGSDGGSIISQADADLPLSYPPVILSKNSMLTLYFGPSGSALGMIARQGRTVFSAGTRQFSFRKVPGAYSTSVPSVIFPKIPVSISVTSGKKTLEGMRVSYGISDPPLAIDPYMIIEWPWEEWRSSVREIFLWDRFPSVLIFDTASYELQDRYFKRLAFFVEKQGYKGKLWLAGDIAQLHAFNAHDYRPESLAAFFELARKENFPLNEQELELLDILLSSGIIVKKGSSFAGGTGALLSISRESVSYLRYMLIAHEGYHGIYFTDATFRAKVSELYASMDARAIAFLESYFSLVDSLGYDTTDSYLMENEFMAYLMQQPLDQIEPYFTGQILERFLRYGGSQDLGDYIKKTRASEFVRAGTELNEFVFEKWGIAGGRTGLYIPN